MEPPSDEPVSKPYHRGRIRWSPIFLARVEGESMSPSLKSGTVLLAVRGLRPRKGDVVIIEHPGGSEMVKRVAAAPGDEAMPGWVLGSDEWLVLGDNRDASTDSREFGALARSAIKGRIVWPR